MDSNNNNNSTSPTKEEDELQKFLNTPLASLEVGDSRFLGFVWDVSSISSNEDVVTSNAVLRALQNTYPNAAHIPISWTEILPPTTTSNNNNNNSNKEENQPQSQSPTKEGYNEDGEPPQSVGPFLLNTLRASTTANTTMLKPKSILVLAIVRFFESKLLGVTCGRLSQVYTSIAKLSLHRYFHGLHTPLECTYTNLTSCMYGLGAGDTEVILNVIPPDHNNKEEIMNKIKQELTFDGFVGSKGETLPRLQNLQGDITHNHKVIPIYRYPGNYSGDEWSTYPWSTTSLYIKAQVEASLQPLVEQRMNHCVTNWYRDGQDFIAHHSDKDLDLLEDGVIVSVSLGSERILELRRKTEPRDVTRIRLPHGSMLVLGWKTNREFTHSIILQEEEDEEEDDNDKGGERISLTMRTCGTFLDTKTNRLFGIGIQNANTLEDVRATKQNENFWDVLKCCVCSLVVPLLVVPGRTLDVIVPKLLLSSSRSNNRDNASTQQQQHQQQLNVGQLVMDTTVSAGTFLFSWMFSQYMRNKLYRQKEERNARNFFSKYSTSGTKY